jgi:hypothetical protein
MLLGIGFGVHVRAVDASVGVAMAMSRAPAFPRGKESAKSIEEKPKKRRVEQVHLTCLEQTRHTLCIRTIRVVACMCTVK